MLHYTAEGCVFIAEQVISIISTLLLGGLYAYIRTGLLINLLSELNLVLKMK